MATLFPMSRRRTGAVGGGVGAVAGLIAANVLKARYPNVQDSLLLYAVLLFLASYFFISLMIALLNRLNARATAGE